MPAKSPQTDYFGINSTKIYSANPSGNFTVTSLPLTRRHLQDLESPSYYNLSFDLIANKFSKTSLHRRSPQQNTTPAEASLDPSERYGPALNTTKSAEAALTHKGVNINRVVAVQSSRQNTQVRRILHLRHKAQYTLLLKNCSNPKRLRQNHET